MASAIRDFSYLFVYSRRLEEYGLASRVLISVFFIVCSLTNRVSLAEATLLKLSLTIIGEIIVLRYFRGLRATLGALRLVVFFVGLGFVVNIISVLMGYAPLSPLDIALGSLQLVAIFIAFSTLFQLISIREWKSLFRSVGLGEYAVLFSMVMSQIPVVLYYASEAFTTTRLKYGNRKLYKFVVPLVLLSIYSSRSLVESYIQYGMPMESKLAALRRKDVYLYAYLTILTALFLVL